MLDVGRTLLATARVIGPQFKGWGIDISKPMCEEAARVMKENNLENNVKVVSIFLFLSKLTN